MAFRRLNHLVLKGLRDDGAPMEQKLVTERCFSACNAAAADDNTAPERTFTVPARSADKASARTVALAGGALVEWWC